MAIHIGRRELIVTLGSAAAGWPLAARAQQGERVRRIGVLMAFDESDPVAKTYVSALIPALADLGWTDGRNLRMDLRGGGGDANRIRALAQELVGLQPDIILGTCDPGDRCPSARDADDPDRFCGCGRSHRERPRPAARPPEWQHHQAAGTRNVTAADDRCR